VSRRGRAVAVVAGWVVAAALLAAGLWGMVRIAHRHDDVRAVPRRDEVSVEQLYAPDAPREVVVRGYVIDAGDGLPARLCSGLHRASPPTCIGPFVDLEGLDENRLALDHRTVGSRTVVWTPKPVSLAGRRRLGALTVADILP